MEWFVIIPFAAIVLALVLIIREASRHRPSKKRAQIRAYLESLLDSVAYYRVN